MKLVILLGVLSISFFGLAPSPERGPADTPGSCPRAEDATYMGAESCKKCHFKQFNAWKKTPMAKAFDSLKPGNAAEAKKKFNIDEKKDFTKDAKCVECHVTGYGKPGGYPAIVEGKTWTEEETKRAASMENGQCEVCHGPGSLTNVYKKDNENYAKAEILKRGMVEPNEANCKVCHSDKSPTIGKDYKFDYAALIKDPAKVHDHVALKNKH